MTEEERINVALIKPRFAIGQTIYVPQKDFVREAEIRGYEARVGQGDNNGNLLGAISGYCVDLFVSVRRGDDSDFTTTILPWDFYDNEAKAKESSKFLGVRLDDDAWRRAIGDRDVEDDESPYHLVNCDLTPCCADISGIRDILLYCKRNNGLIVHNRDELARLVMGHDFKYNKQDPIGKVFVQLKLE